MHEVYDIVVIGAGHNGLVAALDCAAAGLSVCVLEERPVVGGCAITTEPLLPGFLHSPHANTFLYADIMPADIRPATMGVASSAPEAQLGVAFADGRAPVILHRPDLLDRTQASLAVYSREDAERYGVLKRRSAVFGDLLRRGLYAPPDPRWFAKLRERAAGAYRPVVAAKALGTRSARQLIDQLFHAPEVRLLLYALAGETGVGLEDSGSDLAFLGYSLWMAGRWRIPVGGMGRYTEALLAAARCAGVAVAPSSPVAQVVVEQRRAVGVRIAGGPFVGAARGVISAVPVLTLFDRLLPADAPAPVERAELAAFRSARPPSIGTIAVCLTAAPRYASGQHDPAIDACLKTVVGFDTPTDFLEQLRDVNAGRLPRPAGIVRMHSLWDETIAPEGRHIAAADISFPAIAALERSTWDAVHATFSTAFAAVWKGYLFDGEANPPTVLSLDDALGFERRMLVRPGPAQYRTSIGGLYLAGPGVHPGGGVHGACGRNAAALITADHQRIASAGKREFRASGPRRS